MTDPGVHSAHLASTPAGPVTVWVSPTGVRRVEFGALPRDRHTDPKESWPPNLRWAVSQLAEYFQGQRRAFDLDLDLEGATGFQSMVYDRLLAIEYGHTVTYGQVAEDIGRPELARAVGQAVGSNPLPIVVPCHRVVGANGRLVGFGGGLDAKAALLRLEGIEVDGAGPSSRVHPEVLRLQL